MYVIKTQIAITMILCLWYGWSIGQEPVRVYPIPVEGVYGEGPVYELLRDQRGFLWVSCGAGVLKYDGYGFQKVYASPASTLFEDAQGNIWLGTFWGGLAYYSYTRGRFTEFDPEVYTALTKVKINAIAEDSSGNIWIATNGNGLLQYHPQNDSLLRCKEAFSQISKACITALYADTTHLWLGTQTGELISLEYRSHRFEQKIIADERFDNFSITGIQPGIGQDLWLATDGKGLWNVHLQKGTAEKWLNGNVPGKGPEANLVLSLIKDREQTLWVGTDGQGLIALHLPSLRYRRFQHQQGNSMSIASNTVYCITEDRQGQIWTGSKFGGVSLLKQEPPGIEYFPGGQSGAPVRVLSLFMDRHENTWVGTDGQGLYFSSKDGSVKHHFSMGNESMPGGYIHALEEDRRGYIWVATYQNGLHILSPGLSIHQQVNLETQSQPILANNHVTALLYDRHQYMWVASEGGLTLVNEELHVFRYFDKKELNCQYINSMYEDRKGNLWLATDNGLKQVLSSRTELTEMYRILEYPFPHDPEESPQSIIYSLTETPDGRLWLSRNGELYHFEPGTKSFHRYGETQGFTVQAYGLEADSEGNLWTNAYEGLCKFNPNTGAQQWFYAHDGLQGNKFFFRAHLKDQEGNLYFGGTNGYNKLNPILLEKQLKLPDLYITGITAKNKELPLSNTKTSGAMDTLELTYQQGEAFTIHFTGIYDLLATDFVYNYKLEPFMTNWVTAGPDHAAKFSDIPTGSYTFSLEAISISGKEKTKPLLLLVDISSRPWYTHPFILIVLSLLLFVSGLGYFVKSGSRAKGFEKKEDFSDEEKHLFHKPEVPDATKEIGETDKALLQTVHQLILQNLDNHDFDVTALLAEVPLSRTLFYQKIKSLTGYSASEYIILVRLQKGAELILTSEKTISEIAYEVGFANSGHFSTRFKKHFGLSPSLYRNTR
ncbi:two-component regulator propeller domain-containing protein [Rapidithrix thailandica]|uniref:Two-component regulator propeller domain-containing protein n=1 Tax=Rapidithrix thailandica TaxID=413964 RepID=A0AAW9SDL1_9BACT